MVTAVVSLNSELQRKSWIRQGLLQARKNSFFSPLTGNSSKSIVFQSNNENSAGGHTVTFDVDGNLIAEVREGKQQSYGTGVNKLKFSSSITVRRHRLPVYNGDRFDGVNIGDLSITQHEHSRMLLSDAFMRFKDQAHFDAAQGNIGVVPSHIIDLGTTFDYNTLLDIENTVKSSQGFTTGARRLPLEPFNLNTQAPQWMFVVDSYMATKLKQSAGFQSVAQVADVRGTDNMLLSGVIGRIGSLLIVEAPNAFGQVVNATTSGWGLRDIKAQVAGLRQYSGANPATAAWTGQAGFDATVPGTLHSRGLLLGAGALQYGLGKAPDYSLQISQDHGIDSESQLEVWHNVQKTRLTAENVDYPDGSVAGIDYGVVAVDLQVN